MIIRAGQNIQGDNRSFSKESKLNSGFDIQSDNDPVIAKTISIISNCKLDVIFHFSLSFFIEQK